MEQSITTTGLESQKVRVKLATTHLMTGWNCVKTIIENEMYATPEDMGHLMEIMTVISEVLTDPGEDDLQKRVVKLNFDHAKTIWNCINIALNEEMVPQHRTSTAAEALGILAIELDSVVESHRKMSNGLDGASSNRHILEVPLSELDVHTMPSSKDEGFLIGKEKHTAHAASNKPILTPGVVKKLD